MTAMLNIHNIHANTKNQVVILPARVLIEFFSQYLQCDFEHAGDDFTDK